MKLALAGAGAGLKTCREQELSSARRRLSREQGFDATFLLQDRPHALPDDAAEQLRSSGDPGRVVTVAGPWFEGRLRFQERAGDASVVYWHRLAGWVADNLFVAGTCNPSEGTIGLVAVASRDRDAAAAIADQLRDEQASVVWTPRGGRAPFVSRFDAGVWVGGQLDGPAAAELSEFCAQLRADGGRVVVALDFPRHDEVAAARAIGASAVLAKPWRGEDLVAALRAEPGHASFSARPPATALFSRAA